MDSSRLDPKMIAQAKLAARRSRIRTVRKRVAILGAGLTLLFSGMVFAANGIPLILSGGSGNGTGTAVARTDDPQQHLGATLVAFATGLVSDGGNDEEGNGGIGGLLQTAPSSSSAPVQTSQS